MQILPRTVWSIWRSLLEETDKLAKAKLAAVEIFQTQIADDVKVVRQNKLQLAKKVFYTQISYGFQQFQLIFLLSINDSTEPRLVKSGTR